MAKGLFIEANRDAYSPNDVRTMTVGELISILENCNSDIPVFISNDRGDTYGALNEDDVECRWFDENE